jgi:hypothetical protein
MKVQTIVEVFMHSCIMLLVTKNVKVLLKMLSKLLIDENMFH